MVKLVALYREPADIELFEQKYFDEHVPLVQKIPGLRKVEIAKLKSLGSNNKYFLQAEMYFDDLDSFNAAMGSAEGKEAARNIMSFAKDVVEMSIGEIRE